MQVTELEIILFLWGVFMVWAWARERLEHRAAKKFLFLLLEDKQAREQIVAAHEKFMAEGK